MLRAILEYQFMQNALLASILASVVCGIIGVLIIEKKLVMMSGGIAHTAYGGVGLGYLLGFEPIIGAFLFGVAAAFGIGKVNRKDGVASDVIIGLFWSLGMALGILFIALRPGYPPDMNSYLFGNILTVTRSDLTLMIGATVLVVILFVSFFQHWKAFLFDDEFAAIMGIPAVLLEYLLLILVAMTVVVLIRVVGIILVMSLLTAPAATASLFSGKLKNRIYLSILFGVLYCVAGLYLSYELNIASGAAIVIFSVTVYFVLYTIRRFMITNHRKRKMTGDGK